MASAPELKVFAKGDVVSQRYEIEKHLGNGMLGASYLAKHQSSGKMVVLKTLRPNLVSSPKDRERFERSFKAAKNVKHDGLIRYGDLGTHDNTTYFTEEYFESDSLRRVLEQAQDEQKPLSFQDCCQIAIKILDATDALNKAGIIHRNLKPENILVQSKRLGPQGSKVVRTIKVTDGGLADIVNPTIFADGYISRDTASYLAPELAGFEHPGTPQADVFAVGVMLYELLCGQTPKGTYLAPTQLRGDLPEHIDDVVELAMDVDPGGRYPTCRDMMNDIQVSFSGTFLDEARPKVSFRNVLLGVTAATTLFVAMGVYLSVSERPDPVLEAKAKDDRIRNTVRGQNQVPDRAVMEAMVKDHPDMLYVPGGTFIMGRMHAEDPQNASQSEPLARIEKVEGFLIDRYEFPNRTTDPSGAKVKPVSRVSWNDADAACKKVGKRLCTEKEWEKACKGPENLIYAYGDAYDVEGKTCGKGLTEPYVLGDRTGCVSGYGVSDLSGGFREWTATGPSTKSNRHTVKGGLEANNVRGSRCAFAVDENTTYADVSLSFRCCLDTGASATATPPDGAAPTGGGAPDGAAPPTPDASK